ncbi:MAG: class I SAM-dependent methyltransferase [Planctomycetes bacterium]|nr:class I SAM-dependent methyltransferase [Planctomycetota bacterium]
MTELPEGVQPTFDLTSGAKLDAVSTRDLGCELLARLKTPSPTSYHESAQTHLTMLLALRDAIEPLLETVHNRFSTKLLAAQFDLVLHAWRTHGLPLAGATHLEIGSGALNPFARMFTHIMAGVRRAWCLEPDPLRDVTNAVRTLARLAADALIDPASIFGALPIDSATVLANLAGFDLARLRRGDDSGADRSRLDFLPRSVTDTGLPDGSVDVVISNSVMEHVPDVDAALQELARVTRRGGFALHGIDVADHRIHHDASLHPLEFLTVQSSKPIVWYSNRLRLCEFETRFAQHGFRVLDRWLDNKVTVPVSLRQRLCDPWSAMTDEQLEMTWAVYLLRLD